MDPSNFGSFSSGGNSGGANGINVPNNGVTSGANPTVNSSQVNPGQAQGFVGAQPIQSVQPVVSGPTQQPRTVQSPMQQSMQFQPQMMSSGAEDVLLGSGAEPKKSRKGLIVGIVLAMLVLVGVGAGAMLFSKKNTANEIAKSKDTFNAYANYLLFGDAVDNAIDVEINDAGSAVYALDCENKTQAECKDFFEEAKKLLDNFRNSNYKEGLSEESISEVENYFSIFDEYYKYIVFGEMNDDAVLALYVENGYDGAIEYVENYYSDLINSDDTFLASYGNYGVEKTKILIDNIRELEQAGCIVDGQNDQKCMEDFRYSEDTIGRIMDFEYGVSNDMHISINDARNSLVYETIATANLLGNGGDDGKEE